jgi:hypothetical protein
MSSQSHPEPSAGRPSRRSVLRGAGAAGAVGIAAAVGAGAAGGVAAAATRPAAANRANTGNRAGANVEHSAGAAGAPLVVYLRDAASGEFDVFTGTSRAVIVDPDLAARLTRAVR